MRDQHTPHTNTPLGLGIGWRPELAAFIERRRALGFVEIVAENEPPGRDNPALRQLQERGVQIILHGISASFGSAEGVRLSSVHHLARRYGPPLVSEHIAFVHAGGREAGHLMPVERTHVQLAVLADNIRRAQEVLPVPLALENISALLDWPGAEFTPAEFLCELFDRTGVLLLLDIANVHANAVNLGVEPQAFLRALPLERIAYVHVGGGVESDGVYHDSHSAPVPEGVFTLLRDLRALAHPPGIMLERDDDFPPDGEVAHELDRIAQALAHA